MEARMSEETVTRWTPDGRTPRKGAATFIGVKPATMALWQRTGIGPMPRKIAGRVFYRREDLQAFVATGAREAEA
jgi:hypothetical protein